jgi:xanthine dehydrogenase YagR molybdenum-binding subunit
MADYAWPDAQHRTVIGKPTQRVDGSAKLSGMAKYTYDVNPRGLLFGKILRCPYAHATVVSIDTSAAEKMPGVKAVKVLQAPGTEIHWAGDEIVALAAVSEPAAEDALRAIKVEYKQLSFLVSDAAPPPGNVGVSAGPLSQDEFIDMLQNQVPDDKVIAHLTQHGITFSPSEDFIKTLASYGVSLGVQSAVKNAKVVPANPSEAKASWYKKSSAQVAGDPDSAFKQAESVSEGLYGMPVITHCCMESHGAVTEWTSDELLVHISTQNVSGIPGQVAKPLDLPANKVHVMQQHIGGGFGSKFSADRWTVAAAQLSKLAGGKPVKMMLERAAELQVAGARPSAYAHVLVAAKKDGTITGWQSESWGTGGPGGGGQPPIPYIFEIPNKRTQNTGVVNNIGPARAWRAPNHPQACLITMAALDDAAAKLNMDPMDLFLKNIDLTPRADIYRDELAIAAQLSGWKQNWKPRGTAAGPVRRGLGLSIHTWGGRGHNSDCDLALHPDGSVEIKLGTQDLGTGTRTAILMVVADTLGVPMNAIALYIGDTRYPPSGGSGGSTTIGGVSSSTRRAAVDARDLLFEKVAPALKAQPSELESVKGVVRVKGDPSRALPWKQACARLGAVPITVRGKNPDKSKPPDLTNSGVGGVQVADVTVDTETGIVKINRMIAVQDCGLVINPKTAESQIHGALIMGITYSLFEEKVMDPITGRMLNPNMEFYRLAGISDIGELIVHLMTNKYDSRGVIGLGEPPVVSPGAAISNAVANAIGVRVPFLPLTPDRVLAALGTKGGA